MEKQEEEKEEVRITLSENMQACGQIASISWWVYESFVF